MSPRPLLCIAIFLVNVVISEPVSGIELPVRRCGWLLNPTPANWFFSDRDGEWLIGIQGGHQAIGLDDVPDLAGRHWVVTNEVGYGYGCACMTVEATSTATGAAAELVSGKRVIERFRDFKQQPLATCQRGSKLSRMK